jgi:hypothetical protein
MVFDETGERLTPTYAIKKGTRYRYYVSTSLLIEDRSRISQKSAKPVDHQAFQIASWYPPAVRTVPSCPGAFVGV